MDICTQVGHLNILKLLKLTRLPIQNFFVTFLFNEAPSD